MKICADVLSWGRWCFCGLWLYLWATHTSSAAEPFAIRNVKLSPGGKPRFSFSSDTNSYYVLTRASHLTDNDFRAVVLTDGGPEESTLTDDTASIRATYFYRVRKVSSDTPQDQDGDGIDDVYEMRHPAALDPLKPDDSGADADGDGRTNLAEYLAGTDIEVPTPVLPPLVIRSSTTLDCSSTNVVGRDLIVDGAMVTVDCPLRLNSLTLTNAATLTSAAGTTNRMLLTIAEDLYVDAGVGASGSRIDVSARGFSGGMGAGAGLPAPGGSAAGGASHGGAGTLSTPGYGFGRTHDSFEFPTEPGSGGGNVGSAQGARGGGSLRLVVGGTLRLFGQILANAEGARDVGAGAGGSIWIDAGSVVGSGLISASGGWTEPDGDDGLVGGAGGGGRVAVYYESLEPTVKMAAFGGRRRHRYCCWADSISWAGAGSVWLKGGQAASGTLIVDNGNNTSESLTEFEGEFTVPGDLLIRNGAVMGPAYGQQNSHLIVSRNLTVSAGSSLSANRRGYAGGSGPGAGADTTGGDSAGGGSHGGEGYWSTEGAGFGVSYGDFERPSNWGSGGGTRENGQVGGAGGGSLHVTVRGTLRVDGDVSVDGEGRSGAGGGAGAGGSLWITAERIEGVGRFSADGGWTEPDGDDGTVGGSGGGGRVALYYGSLDENVRMSALGGRRRYRYCCWANSVAWAGAGTIWLKPVRETFGTLIVDNGNNGSDSRTQLRGQTIVPGHLIVRRTGVIGPAYGETATHLIVLGDATIEANAGISASYRGHAGGAGLGAGEGSTGGNSAGGGSHGGEGVWSTEGVGFGPTYGSFDSPISWGSGGGTRDAVQEGGSGGGALRLSVSGRLKVDGTISANGEGRSGGGGGAGAGGSLWIQAGAVEGDGRISADGGWTEPDGDDGTVGGAGGGGRVAVHFGTFAPTVQISAYGGRRRHRYCCWANSFAWAGAGTIWLKPLSAEIGTLVVDNGSNGSDSRTQLSASLNIPGNLVVRRAAVVGPAYGETNFHLVVRGNVSVETSAQISSNFRGYPGDSGPGAGTKSFGGNSAGGGSHAGEGNWSTEGVGFGPSYGDFQQPTTFGSGGGSRDAVQLGAAGGGSMKLTVGGTLHVDGSVSSNGEGRGGAGSGAGAGGSLWITAGAIEGTGVIAADGGWVEPDGDDGAVGGSGGGGRVALYYGSLQSSVRVTAHGGRRRYRYCCWADAVSWAAAGTVWLKASTSRHGVLLIDNGDNPSASGTEFVGSVQIPGDLVIRRGSSVTHGFGGPSLRLQVLGDLVVADAGSIDVSARGFRGGEGPGAGDSNPGSTIAGGGGYGGRGGDASNGGPGGEASGQSQAPADLGSGGGKPLAGGIGGAGGGAVQIGVASNLFLYGKILADGEGARAGGAGAGGSVWITARTLQGYGVLSAQGGAGSAGNGGGGGGRIAVFSRCTPVTNGLAFRVGGGAGGGQSGSVFVGVLAGTNFTTSMIALNPKNTYLRLSDDPDAGAALPVDLGALGVRPCDSVRLRRLGDYLYDPPSIISLRYLFGVFSGDARLLSPSTSHRIPGALKTGQPEVFTLPTLAGSLPTDIPEDFAIDDLLLTVPEDAKYLFLTPQDFWFGDNLDPDGDYRLEITRYLYE